MHLQLIRCNWCCWILQSEELAYNEFNNVMESWLFKIWIQKIGYDNSDISTKTPAMAEKVGTGLIYFGRL
jgi:beta-lactamase class D